jgi:glycosyltransferase involved in cell wall biosynthesis
VDLLIRTAAYLHNIQPQIEINFLIYGEGPLRANLEKLSRELGTTKKVHFLGHSDDITRHIRAMNALILTSDHEGLPMVVLEAMALQVPVIAHAVGGLPTALDHGECGILVNEPDPEAYAHAILDLAGDPDKSARLTSAGYKRVRECYSAEQNAGAYCKEYLDLAPDSSG